MILTQEVRSVRPFTCLNSLLVLDVNAIFGEALKAENTTYTIMSDQCISALLPPLSPCAWSYYIHSKKDLP